MVFCAECINFALENNTEQIFKEKSHENFEGKKTLDNPNDGNDTDSRRRFSSRRTIV